MSCGHHCYEIGGPWIGEDPSCPIHGDEAQRRDQDSEDRFDRLERHVEALHKALETALRLIEHYGANHTERGRLHPQEQLVNEIRTLLNKHSSS